MAKGTIPSTANRAAGRRAYMLGNVLIIFGIALFGAAISIAAAGGFAPQPRVGDGSGSRASTASQWIPAVQASTLATPVERSEPSTSPATEPTSQVEVPASVAGATPEASPSEAEPSVPAPGPQPRATHIRIPSVGINTDVIEVGYDIVALGGQQVIQWQVADYAAGHHSLSANPGEGGNIVITGHDDWRGAVFRTLEKAKLGDQIVLTTANGDIRYQVAEIHFRKEVGVPLEERLATGQFLAPMPEERLTLVTCWPYGVDDHRLIVVAKPVV